MHFFVLPLLMMNKQHDIHSLSNGHTMNLRSTSSSLEKQHSGERKIQLEYRLNNALVHKTNGNRMSWIYCFLYPKFRERKKELCTIGSRGKTRSKHVMLSLLSTNYFQLEETCATQLFIRQFPLSQMENNKFQMDRGVLFLLHHQNYHLFSIFIIFSRHGVRTRDEVG